MAPNLSLILCLFAFSALSSDFAHGASPSSPHAPAPSADCSNLILTMADCLSFVSNGSTTTKPEGNCCTGLKTVLKADAACLCEAFRSSAQLGVVLNVTKAVTLPAACKVSAPSATNCGLSETPAAEPAGGLSSPESSPTSTGAAAPGLSSGPENEISPAPSPSLGNSAASSVLPISAVPSLLLPLLLAMFSAF